MSKNSLRILILCTKVPYPPKDGGAKATLELALSLNRRGHEITMLCMNTKKHHVEPGGIPREIREKLHWELVDVDTSIRYTKLMANYFFSSIPYSVERFYSWKFDKRLKQILDAQTFDIVQIEGLYGLAYVPSIRKWSKAKIVYRAHNVEHLIWKRVAEQEKHILKRKYVENFSKRLEQYEKKVMNTYDLLVPISEQDAYLFNELNNTKPQVVIPYGMEVLELIPEPNSSKDFYFLGALDWMPNVLGLRWFLDKCWPRFVEEFSMATCWIAGRNPSKELWRTMRGKGIHFLGEIEDAKQFSREHAIMIVPLFAGSGMRVKIIEAMAMGKPVIATSIAAEGLPVKHRKHILLADNADDFLKAMKELYTSPTLFEELRKNAYALVKAHFSIDGLSKVLEESYYQILQYDA